MRRTLHIIAAIITAIASAGIAAAQSTQDIYHDFQAPGSDYGPRVWWHWMHGNVTRDGIRKDLEWMHDAGIAGFHQFNCQLNPTDVIVEKRVPLFSPEWDGMFSYALDVADSLGLEVSIASSPGWSITGGPWVTMEGAQKKLTWQTMKISGRRRVREELPEPIEYSGPFQDVPQWPKDLYKYRYYRDIAVVAVRTDGMEPSDTVAAWKNKAGYEIDSRVSAHSPATTAVHGATEVIDISDKVRDGVLDWCVPRGEWTIYRFGYNLLGRHNGPVEAAGVGLEADKLSRSAMLDYYSAYLGIMDRASGHRLGSTVKYLMVDSYEAGKGTWTPDMPEQFRSRRGYDLIRWLPVLTGMVVGSARESDDFLEDWRRTLGELIVENHYDLAAEVARSWGMKCHMESHEQATAFIGDGLMAKRSAAVPMGAIWVRFGRGIYSSTPVVEADIRESASAAHIYGGNICAAESFSVHSKQTVEGHYPAYQCHPGSLKRLADAALSCGLNRFIMHCSPHQPEDSKFPGLGLGTFGQWITRHETWAGEARPWHDYLARSCYMLQQGRFSADIAYLYGEDTNITARFKDSRPEIPFGYGYDFINSDIALNVLSVRDGALVTPSGMSYRLLVIDSEAGDMSAELQRRIEQFRAAGVAVCDARGHRDQLSAVAEALRELGIDADFRLENHPGGDIRYVHRNIDGGDIYWVANISPEGRTVEFSMRAEAGAVRILDADGGCITPSAFSVRDGRTYVKLDMTEDDAKFIVLDRGISDQVAAEPVLAAAGTSDSAAKAQEVVCEKELGGPWKVTFQEGREGPSGGLTLDELTDLSKSACDSVRFFSGTMTYSCDFSWDGPDATGSAGGDALAAAGSLRSGGVILKLGKVCYMARGRLNGRDLGLLWHSPYSCDISSAVLKGSNHLEIEVTNVWANKLIGDSSKPRQQKLSPAAAGTQGGNSTGTQGERLTFTGWQFYSPDDPLPASGLIGPVVLESR